MLSVGAMAKRGWGFSVSRTKGELLHLKHGLSVPLLWYANCPWIGCDLTASGPLPSLRDKHVSIAKQRNDNAMDVSALVGSSTVSHGIVRPLVQPLVEFANPQEEELRRLRGHMPPMPRHCVICAKCRGVSTSRRKDVVLSQVQADFTYVRVRDKDYKVLVIAHGETGCIGAINIGPNVQTSVKCIQDFFKYLGLVGTGNNIELLTDAEHAVGRLVKQCDLGARHIIVQRAAP